MVNNFIDDKLSKIESRTSHYESESEDATPTACRSGVRLAVGRPTVFLS